MYIIVSDGDQIVQTSSLIEQQKSLVIKVIKPKDHIVYLYIFIYLLYLLFLRLSIIQRELLCMELKQFVHNGNNKYF